MLKKQKTLLDYVRKGKMVNTTPKKSRKDTVSVTPPTILRDAAYDDDAESIDSWPSLCNYPWNHPKGAYHSKETWL